ncbi:MAG: metallophosphoesterase N-terminal domain-containing protein [Alistipes onderdonkii]
MTKTDANGFYWLNSEKRNELAFVILPAGYDVPTVKAMPQFWQPCTLDANTVEQLDFQLLRADNDSHTMLVATDMHLANRNTPKDYVQFADGFVKELTSAYNSAAPGKVYCLNLGDFSWDGYWYDNKWALPECKQTVEDFNFQMWSVMGNHDNDPYVASDFGAEGPTANTWARFTTP